MTFFTIALVLFLIMDPIGNVSSILSLLEPFSKKRRSFIVLREMFFVLIMMLIFSLFGDFFFNFLQISETTVRLSSGVILFLIALTIIFPSSRSMRAKLPKSEPFIIPIAIPLIAGPALLATVMLYTHLQPKQSIMVSAIIAAWVVSTFILFFASQFERILSKNGLIACEKMMGMILILIAVQRFMDGVSSFIHVYNG